LHPSDYQRATATIASGPPNPEGWHAARVCYCLEVACSEAFAEIERWLESDLHRTARSHHRVTNTGYSGISPPR
jgi:hypothetical protein